MLIVTVIWDSHWGQFIQFFGTHIPIYADAWYCTVFRFVFRHPSGWLVLMSSGSMLNTEHIRNFNEKLGVTIFYWNDTIPGSVPIFLLLCTDSYKILVERILVVLPVERIQYHHRFKNMKYRGALWFLPTFSVTLNLFTN